jgi:hypothetical protein
VVHIAAFGMVGQKPSVNNKSYPGEKGFAAGGRFMEVTQIGLGGLDDRGGDGLGLRVLT